MKDRNSIQASGEKIRKEKIGPAVIAVLFATGEEMSLGRLKKIFKKKGKEIRKALDDIRESLGEVGLTLIEISGKYQLVSGSKYAKYISKIKKEETRAKLGKASLEVLSIIAYKGPITKDEIEIIRGIGSTQVIRSLMVKGLVDETDKNGIKKYLPSLTFLKLTGVSGLDRLPQYEEFRKCEKIDRFLAQELSKEE